MDKKLAFLTPKEIKKRFTRSKVTNNQSQRFFPPQIDNNGGSSGLCPPVVPRAAARVQQARLPALDSRRQFQVLDGREMDDVGSVPDDNRPRRNVRFAGDTKRMRQKGDGVRQRASLALPEDDARRDRGRHGQGSRVQRDGAARRSEDVAGSVESGSRLEGSSEHRDETERRQLCQQVAVSLSVRNSVLLFIYMVFIR